MRERFHIKHNHWVVIIGCALLWGVVMLWGAKAFAQEADLSSAVNANTTDVNGVKNKVEAQQTTMEALTLQADDLASRLAIAEQNLVEVNTRLAVLEAGGGGTDPGTGDEGFTVPLECYNADQPLLAAGPRWFQDRGMSWFQWTAFTRFYSDTTSVRANGTTGTVILANSFWSPNDREACLAGLLTQLD